MLAPALALAGGTAWHLLEPDPARLPGELAFHYVGAIAREQMLLDRQRIQRAFREVARDRGLELRVASRDWASIRWQLTRAKAGPVDGVSVAGDDDALPLDVVVNFLLRAPLAPPVRRSGRSAGAIDLVDVQVLDPVEVAAGILVDALDRRRTRDVFDAACVLDSALAGEPALRTAFVVRLAGVREDWAELLRRPIRPHVIDFSRDLVPLLAPHARPENPVAWNAALCEEVDGRLAPLRELTEAERAFLVAVSDDGDVRPRLLQLPDGDPRITSIASSPALAWKARHVRGQHDVEPTV